MATARMTLEERQRRAIARALALGGARLVKRLQYGLYSVASHSRPDRIHTVSVDRQGRYHCDCEAGLAGHPCHHQAAVYIAKVEHGGGRVTAPAPPAPANVVEFRQRAA
jgi:hypothetical protein